MCERNHKLGRRHETSEGTQSMGATYNAFVCSRVRVRLHMQCGLNDSTDRRCSNEALGSDRHTIKTMLEDIWRTLAIRNTFRAVQILTARWASDGSDTESTCPKMCQEQLL